MVGFDPEYGARPMRRTVTHLVEDTLAEAILTRVVREGDIATIDLHPTVQGKTILLDPSLSLDSSAALLGPADYDGWPEDVNGAKHERNVFA